MTEAQKQRALELVVTIRQQYRQAGYNQGTGSWGAAEDYSKYADVAYAELRKLIEEA